MDVLPSLVAALASGSVAVVDLTSPLSEDTPVLLNLPLAVQAADVPDRVARRWTG